MGSIGIWLKFGTAPKQKQFFLDINLKFKTQLVHIFGFDFLAVLESNFM